MILCRSVYYDRPGNFTRKGSTTQSGKFQALEGTSTGTVPIPTLPEWRECGGWQDLLKSGELRHDPLHARPEVRIDFPSTVAQLRHVAAGEAGPGRAWLSTVPFVDHHRRRHGVGFRVLHATWALHRPDDLPESSHCPGHPVRQQYQDDRGADCFSVIGVPAESVLQHLHTAASPQKACRGYVEPPPGTGAARGKLSGRSPAHGAYPLQQVHNHLAADEVGSIR